MGQAFGQDKKNVSVPYSFRPVEMGPPKAKRKKFPFQGFIDFQGLKIDVENGQGSFREGVDPDGHEWRVEMHHHYGEIRGTEGVDGDKLDCYVGENTDSPLVVVVHQQNPDTKEYDEDKVMLGFDTVRDAVSAYKKQYDKPGFFQDKTVLNIGEFWHWCHHERNKGKRVKKARWEEALVRIAGTWGARPFESDSALDFTDGELGPFLLDVIEDENRNRQVTRAAVECVIRINFRGFGEDELRTVLSRLYGILDDVEWIEGWRNPDDVRWDLRRQISEVEACLARRRTNEMRWARDERSDPRRFAKIDLVPPKLVADAARKGLEYRDKQTGDKAGLTPEEASEEGVGSGVQRAVNLKNRDELSPDTVRRMNRFFVRHEKNKAVSPEFENEPWKDRGYVAWLLWGGDAGREWASKTVKQLDEEKTASSRTGAWTRERSLQEVKICFLACLRANDPTLYVEEAAHELRFLGFDRWADELVDELRLLGNGTLSLREFRFEVRAWITRAEKVRVSSFRRGHEVVSYRAVYKRRRRQRNPSKRRERRLYRRKRRQQRKRYMKRYRKKFRKQLQRRRKRPSKRLAAIRMPIVTIAPFELDDVVIPPETTGDVVGFEWTDDWAFVEFDDERFGDDDVVAVPVDDLLEAVVFENEDDEDYVDSVYHEDGRDDEAEDVTTAEDGDVYDPIDLDVRRGSSKTAQNGEEPSSGGGKRPGGMFVRFMEEHGDDKMRSPDTGNEVKLKSLTKSEKGKEIIKGLFLEWLKDMKGKEDTAPKSRSEEEEEELQKEEDASDLTDDEYEDKYGEPKPGGEEK